MAIKINYTLTKTNTKETIDNDLGKIYFFDKYTPPSPFFPYYYLGEKSEIINYQNWPFLVDYLYDKKIGFFNNNYEYIDNFEIEKFYYTKSNSSLFLKFKDNDVNKILFKALIEDREMYRVENGNYSDWNKTITPINDLTANNITILFKNNNYYITSFIVESLTIVINMTLSNNIAITDVNNQKMEFGLYRIPRKSRTDSIYYSGIKGKTFCITDNNNLIGGLKTRSSIMGHSHNHTHNIDHTHTLSHTHSLNNHSHGMIHSHDFYDFTNINFQNFTVVNGSGYATYAVISNINENKTTSEYQLRTGNAFNDITDIFDNQTSSPNENLMSDVLNKSINKDNIHTNDINFRVGNKTFGENYVIFPYIYGKIYNP